MTDSGFPTLADRYPKAAARLQARRVAEAALTADPLTTITNDATAAAERWDALAESGLPAGSAAAEALLRGDSNVAPITTDPVSAGIANGFALAAHLRSLIGGPLPRPADNPPRAENVAPITTDPVLSALADARAHSSELARLGGAPRGDAQVVPITTDPVSAALAAGAALAARLRSLGGRPLTPSELRQLTEN